MMLDVLIILVLIWAMLRGRQIGLDAAGPL